MIDIDFIHAKNNLEILIYEVEMKYRGKDIPPKHESRLNGLKIALSTLLKQDSYIETLKKEIITVKLQNIKAYKDNAMFKNKMKLWEKQD